MANNKLSYISRDGNEQDFPERVARIQLPNGEEYTLEYDEVRKALEVNKVTGTVSIIPSCSNVIYIK